MHIYIYIAHVIQEDTWHENTCLQTVQAAASSVHATASCFWHRPSPNDPCHAWTHQAQAIERCCPPSYPRLDSHAPSTCSGKGLVEELEALYGKVRQQAGCLLATLTDARTCDPFENSDLRRQKRGITLLASKPSGQRDKKETAADRGGASEGRELQCLLATACALTTRPLQRGCVIHGLTRCSDLNIMASHSFTPVVGPNSAVSDTTGPCQTQRYNFSARLLMCL